MHCPISRINMIAITGYSNLLRSNIVIQKDNTVLRNVSIIFPNNYTANRTQEAHAKAANALLNQY